MQCIAISNADRIVRYALVAWLGAAYGRTAMQMRPGTLARWYGPVLWTVGILLAGGLLLGYRKICNERKAEDNERSAMQAAASKAG